MTAAQTAAQPTQIAHLIVRLRTLRQISPTELGLFMVALPLVAAVRVALWILPSAVIVRLVARFESSKRGESPASRVTPSMSIWAVEAASRRIPRATCLTQAIAAKLLLRFFGYDAQLCLGVARRIDGALRAHAWLERNGRPVIGGAEVHSLVQLPGFGGGARAEPNVSR